MRLNLAPEADTLDERPRLVDLAGDTEGQRRVEMEMRVDERRRDETARGIDLFRRCGLKRRADLGDAPVADRDVDAGAAIRQIGASEDEIRGHAVPLRRALEANGRTA